MSRWAAYILAIVLCLALSGTGLDSAYAQTQKKAAPKAAASSQKATKKPAPKAATKKPAAKSAVKKPAPKSAPKAAVKKAAPRRAAAPPAEPTSAPLALPISTICVDAQTGIVISESNADIARPPASMIKLMLMLMVVEGVDAGKWTLETPITVTERAQGMGGTQILVKAGDVWPLEHLMQGVAVASANDGAMAVAEGLWGSEAEYLKAANLRAAELGMTKTRLNGVHGLPPDKGEDFDQSSARDMATLARHCVTHPKIMEWSNLRSYQLRPESAAHASTNKLLFRMKDCDGLKTGFIRAAGFCITATASRGGNRLISVVMGHPNKYERFNEAERLLEEGFSKFVSFDLLGAGHVVDTAVPAPDCIAKQIKLVTGAPLHVRMLVQDGSKLKYSAVLPEQIVPPVQSGTVVGTLIVRIDGTKIGETSLVIPNDLKACGWEATVEPNAPPTWSPPKKGWFFRRK